MEEEVESGLNDAIGDPQLVGRLLLRVAEFGLESGGEELPYGAGTRNFKVFAFPVIFNLIRNFTFILSLSFSIQDLMSWSEKVSKEQEAMKVWEQILMQKRMLIIYHDDYEGVGGDESSIARRGDPRLGPLCRNLWQVLHVCPCPLHS